VNLVLQGGSVEKQASSTAIDLGDELLAQIIEVVQKSPLPVHRKLKALVRAGKIGEMNLGQFSDECSEAAFSCSERAPSFGVEA
jgi:hypothetical protein